MTPPTPMTDAERAFEVWHAENCGGPCKLKSDEAEAWLAAFAAGRRAGMEEAIKEVDRRIAYQEKYRLHQKDKLRSGWSGIESGSCCRKCLMKSTERNPLRRLVGCQNPFQLPEVCECHLPFRKVAGESIQQKLTELRDSLRTQASEQEGK